MTPVRFLCLVLLLGTFFLFGCVTAEYSGPQKLGLSDEQTSRIYDADFETVWYALTTYAPTLFFLIEQFDRETGTIIAKFTGNPQFYIDGGMYTQAGTNVPQQYAAYLRNKNLKLDSEIQIKVAEISQRRTRITVNAKYAVQIPASHFVNSFTGQVQKGNPTIWSFDSRGSDTQVTSSSEGTGDSHRTFSPTGKLESEILEEIGTILI